MTTARLTAAEAEVAKLAGIDPEIVKRSKDRRSTRTAIDDAADALREGDMEAYIAAVYGDGKAADVLLTQDEQLVAAQMGIDPETVRAYKERHGSS